jgi:hypothetical protein
MKTQTLYKKKPLLLLGGGFVKTALYINIKKRLLFLFIFTFK